MKKEPFTNWLRAWILALLLGPAACCLMAVMKDAFPDTFILPWDTVLPGIPACALVVLFASIRLAQHSPHFESGNRWAIGILLAIPSVAVSTFFTWITASKLFGNLPIP
ncbi:hypothetical protein DES53_101140 [Roseimicrobium gellanilyticum]|uniref:Uncharacterized protein n=1 Tax=Roseimicrobium gellanilyticum TaxID=748857 RepID=A0A366HSU3_9BACT|nr:hypothetical protein DES53_101140 [Roseimicrobium gellanilyticum]